MSGPQIHLLLNHVPVIGIWFAAAALAIGVGLRSPAVARFGIGVLLVLAILAYPVFFSGEPAEKAVEHLPGVTERLIHDHEDLARIAMIGLQILGLAALWSLIRHRGIEPPRGFLTILLLATVLLGGTLAWTAHRGGLIHHQELRAGAAPASGQEAGDHDDD